MSPLLDEWFASAAFAPLHASAQQGWAPIAFHRSLHREPIPHRQTPKGYTRANHAKYVAAVNAVVAAQLDLRWRDTKALVWAGALHDVGHLPGGHSMEHAVRAINPAFCHETRGAQIVRESAEINALLKKSGASVESILNVMAERGPLGALQRVTDTLAYCFVDMLACAFMGHQNKNHFLWTVHAFLASLQCVEPDGALRLSHAQPLLEILTWRALLYRDQFLGLAHARADDALMAVFTRLNDHAVKIDPRRFASDEDALARLTLSVNTLGNETATVLKAMLDMPNQTGAPKGWHAHEFASVEAMRDWLAYERDADDLADRSFRYVRRPERLLVKTVTVVCDGERLMVGPRAEEIIPIEGPAAVLYEWTG